MDEPVLGHLVLDQPQDQVGGGYDGRDPQELEPLLVPWVVQTGDRLLDHVLLLDELADQHVVLVVAGDGDHQVRPRYARTLQDPQLRGVPVLDVVLELLLDRHVAIAVVLDQRHLMPLVQELTRQVPPDLPGSDDQYVHPTSTTRRQPSRRPPSLRSRASRSPPSSGRSCGAPAARTTPRGTGRGCARSPSAP